MATKSKKLIVEEFPSLERDTYSNAIVNTDTAAYANRILRHKKMQEDTATIVSLQNTVSELNDKYSCLQQDMKRILKLLNK